MAAVRLGAFVLEAPIGEGGMGVVWRAHHHALGEPVAIKVLSEELSSDPRFVNSFRDEVRAMSRLAHPGIVPVYDHGMAKGDVAGALGADHPTPWLAMAWLGGGTLEHWRGKLSWDSARGVLVALLEALAHAHAHGVVHRDIKPANVLLADENDPTAICLTDFGVAHAYEEAGSISRAGTPDYMAPEQLTGTWREQGPWTDLYALGCMAWELITGDGPFAALSAGKALRARHAGDLPSLRPRCDVPPDLEPWLARLLEPEPWDRPQRAADVLWALQGLSPPSSGVSLRIRAHKPKTIPLAGASEDVPPWPGTWRDELLPPPLPGAGLGLLGLREPPLCGRVQERDALWGELERAIRERRGHAVVLEGPAGLGKSRLARWLCEEAHARAGAVVWRAYHGPIPDDGHGLGPMVARGTHTLGLDLAATEERLRALLEAQGAPNGMHAHALASWVDPAGAADDTGPVLVREARFEPITALLGRVARVRPVVLWLDDVPWGSEALALARYLLESGEPGRLLIVLTAENAAIEARPMARRGLERLLGHPRASRLDVGPLPQAHHRALVESVVGLAGPLVDELAERTAGSPLFALQVLADYAERGLLIPQGDGYALAESEAPAPRDLTQVWTRRVDAALAGRSAEDVAALELLAVLGGRVDENTWREAAKEAYARVADDFLHDLLERRLLDRQPEGALSFAHDALRDVLLERASAAWRIEGLHRAAAWALEVASADPERIARHWLEAGAPERALPPLTRAVRSRIRQADSAGAHALLAERDQALEAAEVALADPRWGEGWLLTARLARLEGNPESAAPVLERLLADARTHGWEDLLLAALLQQAWVLRWKDGIREARAHLEVVAAAAEQPRLQARARRELAETLVRQGELAAAQAVGRRAWRDFQRLRDLMELTRCEALLADTARRLRHWPEAEARWRRARALWKRQQNPLGEATCALGLADTLRWTEQTDEASDTYAWVEHNAHNAPDRLRAQLGLALLVLETPGQHDRARVQLQGLTPALEQSRDAMAAAAAHLALAHCLAIVHRWEQAEDHVAHAARLAMLPSEDVARLAGRLGDRAQQVDRPDAARRYWKVALDHWRALHRDDEADTMQAQLRETDPDRR